MEWLNGILDWFTSFTGWRITSGAIIPFVAIVLAGLLGAASARGAIRKLVAQRDREQRVAAVTALVTSGQQAAKWASLTPAAKDHAEDLASRADIEVRLLPAPGSELAADWAAHQISAMRTNSVSYSFQAEETVGEFVDRLAEWLHHPRRAKKLFAADLERWRFDTATPDALLTEQQDWADAQSLQPATVGASS